MNEKKRRQAKILELIGAQSIGRQQDLSRALGELGVSTTQSTLSKDLKELGIVKVPEGDQGFRFRAPSEGRVGLRGDALLHRELSDFVVGLDGVAVTAAIKTITGHAQGVCEAIDQARWSEVVGTLAGENTIFILCRSEEARVAVDRRIREVAGL